MTRQLPLHIILSVSFLLHPLCLSAVVLFAQLTVAQDHLPWDQLTNSSEAILHPPSGPLEVLERFDIGPKQIECFVSGQTLAPGEEQLLIKILYHLPRLGLDHLQQWRRKNLGLDRLAAAPVEHRGQIIRLTGRAKHVERKPLLAEQKELFEFDHYYLVTIALDDSRYEALVASRTIPVAWAGEQSLDEPTAADAMFLKLGDATLDQPPLIFAAPALAWYPDRPRDEHHIGPSQLALARFGMDVSLWDGVRASKDPGLAVADREGFYQLLNVLAKDNALFATHHSPIDVVALLEKPAEHFGDAVQVEGVARRIMRIAVNDADIQSRFGRDHYYEIDLFLPLGRGKLHFGKTAQDKMGPTYHNSFPATLIACELPAGLREGENVHELIRVEAVFFKTWAYRSSFASQFNQLQSAPLFIARRPQIVSMPSTANWITTSLVMLAMSLGIGMAAIIVWFYRRDDRAAARQTRTQIDVRPDFSGLK